MELRSHSKAHCLIASQQPVTKPAGGVRRGVIDSQAVRHDRGLATLAITAPFVVLGTLAWVVMGSISSAHGYVPAPYLNCVNISQANLSALERSLAPTNGATAQVGALVTFAGNSEVPLRFSVASSPALLSNPDIDSGPGSAQPFSSREPNVDTYTFTSTRAAITPKNHLLGRILLERHRR
jgi:hypothetical protein